MVNRVGKLSIDELRNMLLKQIDLGEGVILGPSIGVDAAILETKNLIVAHIDPITGARKNLGKLAIMIASNDIVAAGARPRFAMVCLILPTKSEEDMLMKIQRDLVMKAKELGISIVGGHTEFSPSVKEPIIIASILGDLIGNLNERMKEIEKIKKNPENYHLVQILPAALEATAIIANDFEELIKNRLSKEEIEYAKSLIDQLSIYKAGIEVFENEITAYAHDPTEGGIIVALKEMGDFLNVGFEIEEDKIMMLNITKRILNSLRLNPLKSLSSGCLLCVVNKDKIDLLDEVMRKENFAYSIIGNLKRNGRFLISKEGLKKDLNNEKEEEEVWRLFRFGTEL